MVQEGLSAWEEQAECRLKPGAMVKLYWKMRTRKKTCGNCAFSPDDLKASDLCVKTGERVRRNDDQCDFSGFSKFSKLLGVGRVKSVEKIFLHEYQARDEFKDLLGAALLLVKDANKQMLSIDAIKALFNADGFLTYEAASEWFMSHYNLEAEWLPFWVIKWGWQSDLREEP